MLPETIEIKNDFEDLGFRRSEISTRAVKMETIFDGRKEVCAVEININISKILYRLEGEVNYPDEESRKLLSRYFRERAEDFVEKGYYIEETENEEIFYIKIEKAGYKENMIAKNEDDAKYVIKRYDDNFKCGEKILAGGETDGT